MSTRRSPSSSKNSKSVPFGGAFLVTKATPGSVFTPEDLKIDSRLMGRAMRDFVRHEVLPILDRLEAHEDGLLRDLVRQAGALGLLAGGLPPPYGLGLSKTTLALLAEKSVASLSFAVTIGVHAGVAALPLLFFGTNDQKERYLPSIAKGETIAAFALTEANAGSDALALETRAILSAKTEGYILDGIKLWVTNAGIADLFTVFAYMDGAGPTAFLVDRSAPGLAVGPEENKMGLRGSSTCRLALDRSPIAASQLLGEPGAGHRPALYALNPGRFQIGAIALGGAKEALRLAAAYALYRRQSGREIANFELIRQKLAQMAARIFVLESMVYRTAGYWDTQLAETSNGDSHASLAAAAEEYAIECALIKVFGTEVLGHAVDEALQIHGSYGYSEGYPITRLYRDCRVFRIFEGTNEINRLAVAQQIRRRSERERLPLDSSIAQLAKPPAWPSPGDPLVFASVVVARIRHVLLMALGKTRHLPDNQEAAAAVADLCAILFGLESAWLRIGKISRNSDRADLEALLDLLLLSADSACVQSAEAARIALLSAGSDNGETARALAPLYQRPLIDLASLHKQIAREVVAHEGYPW